MKRMTTLASAIMMAAAANVSAKTVETTPFEVVKVNVPANVRFVYGENYQMNVRSANNEADKLIRWTVKDGVLSIRTRDGEEIKNLRITITAPLLPDVTTGRNVEPLPKENTTVRDLAQNDK